MILKFGFVKFKEKLLHHERNKNYKYYNPSKKKFHHQKALNCTTKKNLNVSLKMIFYLQKSFHSITEK